MSDFFPQGYTAPTAGGGYLKFEVGETRFRAISKPIIGWQGWATTPDGGSKPVRSKDRMTDASLRDVKPFWAFAVLHKGEVKILEVTQKSVMQAIQALSLNPEWGSLFSFDMIVTRTGADKNSTKYTVTPCPKKQLDEAAVAIVKKAKIDLDALWINGDPMAQAATELVTDSLPF